MTGSDEKPNYPLGQNHRDEVATHSGRSLSDLTISNVLAGEVGSGDVSVNAETLEMQASFARDAGYALSLIHI